MEKIHVCVRVRPIDTVEASKGIPWNISGNSISLSNQSHKFDFDRVLGKDARNMDVYYCSTKDIVSAAVGGFNGTVFAYGQTSSGKTHTMRGSKDEPGVIPLAVQDVFNNMHASEGREFLLRMSYMEIYNEEINDLLVPEHRKLQIHESTERGIFVAGLREEIVASPEQVMQLMEFGESHRHFGETNMNVHSSRSHTIFRMVIESRVKNDEDAGMLTDAVRVSVLNLVDLAGSERVAKTGAKGDRLKEGSHINKSLMTLGTVINKLSEGVEAHRGHVPYRDSKLTRILQPALGGNAKTAIICNITPSVVHVDETKGTLQFASRALRVTNCAQVNEVMTDAALLKRQKKEIEELRAKLQESHSEHLEEEILNLRNTLLQSELEKERIALELQEEKRAQAERERKYTLQIENLSTMVLYSTIDDREKQTKKINRRETWCPALPSREYSKPQELDYSTRTSSKEETVPRREMSLPPPFHELCEAQDFDAISPSETGQLLTMESEPKLSSDASTILDETLLLDSSSCTHVTTRKRKHTGGSLETVDLQSQHQELITKYQELENEHEEQVDSSLHFLLKTKNLEIDELKKRLNSAEAALKHVQSNGNEKNISELKSKFCDLIRARDKQEADDIKSLMLEFDDVRNEVELLRTMSDKMQSLVLGSIEIFSSAKESAKESYSLAYEEVKAYRDALNNIEKQFSAINQKFSDVEDEKKQLEEKLANNQLELEEVKTALEEATSMLEDTNQSYSEERDLLLSEISYLKIDGGKPNGVTIKENDKLKKELEKVKLKLRDTEVKLKNTIQDKSKLESQRAMADRELKSLRQHSNIMQRDIYRRESVADRRESKTSDTNRANQVSFQLKNMELERTIFDLEILQGKYEDLEQMLGSVQEKLVAAENDLITANTSRETLYSELETTSKILEETSLELSTLKREYAELATKFEEREDTCRQLKDSFDTVSNERDELAMQISEALLQMEEEKAALVEKEVAVKEQLQNKLIMAEEKLKLWNSELANLTAELKIQKEGRESSALELEQVREKLQHSDEEIQALQDTVRDLQSRIEMLSLEKDEKSKKLKSLKRDLETSKLERDRAYHDSEKMRSSLEEINFTKSTLLSQIDLLKDKNDKMDVELTLMKQMEIKFGEMIKSLEKELEKEKLNVIKETAKLQFRLNAVKAKLDASRGRHQQTYEEKETMHKKFEVASRKLNEEIVACRIENLELKKKLYDHGIF